MKQIMGTGAREKDATVERFGVISPNEVKNNHHMNRTSFDNSAEIAQSPDYGLIRTLTRLRRMFMWS